MEIKTNILFENRHKWDPAISFLRQGRTKNGLTPTFWHFTELKIFKYPIAFVECSIHGFGHTAVGLGDAFTFKEAASKALAEAWERLWMFKLAASGDKQITSSNGFAAGKSAAYAIEAAAAECIEREVMLKAWQQQQGWNRHKLRSLVARYLLEILTQNGWCINIFLLPVDGTSIVLAGLARHHELGAVFDTKYCPSMGSIRKTELNLLRSLLRMTAVQSRYEPKQSWTLPEDADPSDHMKFYRNPLHLDAFSFLNKESSSSNMIPQLENMNHLKSKLLCDVSELPAIAYAWNKTWSDLSWGSKSIKGRNPWPHPLS